MVCSCVKDILYALRLFVYAIKAFLFNMGMVFYILLREKPRKYFFPLKKLQIRLLIIKDG